MLRFMKGEGVEDLTMISSMSNGAIVSNLSARLNREEIYTALGDVLISVNPYKKLSIYGPDIVAMYKSAKTSSNTAPHIFGTAQRSYSNLVEDNQSQSIIISGESGAGKTVAAKFLLQYFVAVSPSKAGSSSSSAPPSSSSPYGGGGGGGGGPPPTMPRGPGGGRGAVPPVPGRGRGGRGGAPPVPGRGGARGRGRGGAPPVPGRGRGGQRGRGGGMRGGGPAPPGGMGGGGGGGGKSVEQIKKVIMDSNPVLEAFGNAKTVRNDNSSRFGKYLEIQFEGNAPVGGQITSFLLESTRVAFQGKGERNFHIFYDLFKGVTPGEREEFGLGNDPSAFHYLAQSGCTTVDGVDDAAEFAEVKSSMETIGISGDVQNQLWRILAAILWLGNIEFIDDSPARVKDQSALEWAAYLLQVSTQVLEICLTHKFLQSGSARATTYQSPQNAYQSVGIRDALAKTLYSRMFDFLVSSINSAMSYGCETNVVGILDIYGFEIFEHNSFEQFCINYVNERLQQIFIDLTIKAEQDEYQAEGISWKPISYFNNKIVCDLIEASRPPGLFRTLDDVCRTVHAADQETMDKKYMERVVQMEHPHLKVPKEEGFDFTVKHYAGDVSYDARGFAFKNKDTLFVGLIQSMQESESAFIKSLFPEDMNDNKSAPPTSGTKIRQSSSYLVQRLNKTVPHYVRCIKSNDSKTPMGFNSSRVEHQVKYLGLLENVRVRKAGHSYRTMQDYFTNRYGILCTKTDEEQVPYDINVVIDWIRKNVTEINVNDEIHLGKEKVFVRSPESIFILEDLRSRRIDPEGYKEQLKEYKEKEKIARQQLSKGSPGKKCAIM